MTADRASLVILIVDDDSVDRDAYKRYLGKSGRYTFFFEEASTLADGVERCRECGPDGVLLDFFLPDGEGLEFFELQRGHCQPEQYFTIMLTGQGSEVVAARAISLGATDYLPKHLVDSDTLCQAVHSAQERTELRRAVRQEQHEKDLLIERLRRALGEVSRLSGLLPICAHCKSIRKDDGYWQRVEAYIEERTEAEFSHGICPDCLERYYGDDAHPDRADGDSDSAE